MSDNFYIIRNNVKFCIFIPAGINAVSVGFNG